MTILITVICLCVYWYLNSQKWFKQQRLIKVRCEPLFNFKFPSNHIKKVKKLSEINLIIHFITYCKKILLFHAISM